MQDEPHVGPLVGTACFVVREGKLLLMRRLGSHGAGTWCTPGGHLDFGEAPAACAARETREETGIAVTNIRFMGITNDRFAYRGERHYVTLWFAADYAEGDTHVAAPREADAVGWFAPGELPEPLFLSLLNLLSGNCLPELPQYLPEAFRRPGS